jgi:tetratricopeptide (TPR) repeat protein
MNSADDEMHDGASPHSPDAPRPEFTVLTPRNLQDAADAAGQPATAMVWEQHAKFKEQLSVGGEFWADVVKRLKKEGRFEEALRICEREMPLPGAYEHALICLRKLLQKDKSNLAVLQTLYACAVEADVMTRLPCLEYQGATKMYSIGGYDVAVRVHEWMKAEAREFPYKEFGYRWVRSLNKTDRSRLVAALGEPTAHRDPLEATADLWDRGTQEVGLEREASDREFRQTIQGLIRREPK